MKNKKFLSVLVTLAVLFGCMNGVVLADDEVDEVPETSEEQIEETEEEIETTEATETESEETEETDSEQPEESEQDAEIPDEQETEESDAVEIEYDEYDSADDVAEDAYYINRTWNGTEVVSESEPYTGTSVKLPESGGAINGWFYVDENITVNSRLLIASGNTVNLVLVDGVKVTVNGGIDVPDGATLHIYGQSGDSGNLIIQNVAENLAGIGGNSSHNNGDIFIHGGILNVTVDGMTGSCGAGIGNGVKTPGSTGNCGDISIYGGNIHVVANDLNSSGIGGGMFAPIGNINIYGGKVYSQGGASAAGIGTGMGIGSCNIEIYGGEIDSWGGTSAAGIGIGDLSWFPGDIGSIRIHGGTVRAYASGEYCTGIGAGKYQDDIAGTIEISGGTVIASGGNFAAGIGVGCNLNNSRLPSTDVDVNISGGTITAYGGISGAAIGVGQNGSFADGTVTISGGSVSLYAGSDACCIGPDLPSDSLILDTSLSHMRVNTETSFVPAADRKSTCFSTEVSYVKIIECLHDYGEWAALEDGEHHSFSCAYCIFSDVQLHEFTGGECLDCGYIKFEDGPEFIGHQMLLSGDIVIRYWVKLGDGIDPQTSNITFEGQRMDPTVPVELTEGDLDGYGRAYYVDVHISSIQMAQSFTPTLHYFVSDSEKSLEDGAFSALDYLNYGKTHFAAGTHERKIVDALADYGYFAQMYLSLQNGWSIGPDGYLPMPKVTRDYDEYTIMNSLKDYKVSSNIDHNCFDSCSFAMKFGDQLSLNIYFTPANGATIDIDNFRVVNADGYDVSTSFTNGRYVVTISGISVCNCDHTFEVVYNDSNYVRVSPFSFVYAMLRQQSGSSERIDAGQNMVCALYSLYEACRSN